MADMNCPNCGYAQEPRFATAKMTTCASCTTTLYLVGDHLKNAGNSGEMHDAPLLFQVGQTVQIDTYVCDILGHARFDYGRGWWDEYFAFTRQGGEVWISVDEGDIVLQERLPEKEAPSSATQPGLGETMIAYGEPFRVTERSNATCIAVRGEFPEILYVGSEYSYVNCQGENGLLLSGEFSAGTPDWYIGQWVDPFELQVRGVT